MINEKIVLKLNKLRLIFLLVLGLCLLSFNIVGDEDEKIVVSPITIKKEPPPDRGEVRELVNAVILDKYIKNLTWAVRPENFKEICSSKKYPDPVLREQCQIDILEYKRVEAPFVKIKIKYLEGPKRGYEEEVDCLFYRGGGISAAENEDFLKLKIGESYSEVIYRIEKPSRKWNRFVELGDEYCEFGIVKRGKLASNSSAKIRDNIFKKIFMWMINLFKWS